MTTVSPASYPKTFNAMQLVDLDNGLINRLEPSKNDYHVPEPWCYSLPSIEEALEQTSLCEIYHLIQGSDVQIKAMVIDRPCLASVHDFLSAYFENWNN